MDDPTRNEQGLVHPTLAAGHARGSKALEALDAAEAKRLRMLELLDEDAQEESPSIRRRKEDETMAELIDCGTGAVLDLVRAITYALLD